MLKSGGWLGQICAQVKIQTFEIVEVLLAEPEGCEEEYQNATEQGTFTLSTPAICSPCLAV